MTVYYGGVVSTPGLARYVIDPQGEGTRRLVVVCRLEVL